MGVMGANARNVARALTLAEGRGTKKGEGREAETPSARLQGTATAFPGSFAASNGHDVRHA